MAIKKDPLGFLRPGWGDRPALSRYGNNEPVLDADAPGDDDAESVLVDSLNDGDTQAIWDKHNGRIASNCYRYGFQN